MFTHRTRNCALALSLSIKQLRRAHSPRAVSFSVRHDQNVSSTWQFKITTYTLGLMALQVAVFTVGTIINRSIVFLLSSDIVRKVVRPIDANQLVVL